MHFFRTIIAVCSGPSAFPDLINRNPVRAIFHLFLLSVLLAFAVAALQIAAVKEQRAVISAALSDYFGSVVVGEKTVLPAKHEKERKTFILTRQLRLDYLPDSAELLKGIGDWRERTGIVWTPRGFLLWSATEAEPGKYMLVPMPFPSNAFSLAPFMDSPAPLTAEEIEEYVQKNYFSGAADAVNKPSASIPVANLTAAAFAVYNAFIGFAAFTGLFFTALVASLLFAGAQSIFAPRGEHSLKFPRMLTLMAYAAFPPLILASLVSSLVPFISFQTLFFILFFIYQLLAYGAVQHKLNPPPPPSDDDEDFY